MKRLTIPGDDVLAVFGLAVLAIGLGLVAIPLALIAVGALVLIYAVLPDQKVEPPK